MIINFLSVIFRDHHISSHFLVTLENMFIDGYSKEPSVLILTGLSNLTKQIFLSSDYKYSYT